MSNLKSTIRTKVKNWWVSLVIGMLTIVVGIWSIFTPLSTFTALVVVFVVMLFLGGIMEIVNSISNRDAISSWGWSLAMGIIDLIFATILLTNMGIAPLVLCYFIAFWVLFRSIWGIGISIDLKSYKGSNWGLLLVTAILGVALSIILFVSPLLAAVVAAYFVGLGLLIYGFFRIYLSYIAFKINKKLKEIEN